MSRPRRNLRHHAARRQPGPRHLVFRRSTSSASPSGSTRSACTTSKAAGPARIPKDIEFFDEAKRRTFRHARLAAFGATRRKGVTAADDEQVRLLIDAETPVVTIVGKTSLLHVTRSAADDARREPRDDRGHRPLPQGARAGSSSTTPSTRSTATRRSRSTRWRRCRPPNAAGADVVVLCDTNGGSIPARDRRDHARGARRASRRAIGIHTHDDIGLGVANALAALEAGRDARAGHHQRLSASGPATAT